MNCMVCWLETLVLWLGRISGHLMVGMRRHSWRKWLRLSIESSERYFDKSSHIKNELSVLLNMDNYDYLQETGKSQHGKTPHSAWSNYDDLNEYFWSVHCFIFLIHISSSSVLSVTSPTSFHSGHLIVSHLGGLCGMMVTFSNPCMIQGL